MKLVEIGKISRLHGYKGALVVYTPTGKESALASLSVVWIGLNPTDAVSYPVKTSDWMPKGWKLELSSVTSEEIAKPLIGKTLFAQREDLPNLDNNEFYLSDLVELTGYEMETQKCIGPFIQLQESENTPKAKATCWVFRTPTGELQVPAVAHFIHQVDLISKKIWLKNLNELP